MKFVYQKVDLSVFKENEFYQDLNKIFRELLVRYGDEVDKIFQIIQILQDKGYVDASFHLDKFKKHLIEQGVIKENPKLKKKILQKESRLSKKGKIQIRADLFKDLFPNLKLRGRGEHYLNLLGDQGTELEFEKRKFEFGDRLDMIDYQRSFMNSFKRQGALNLDLEEKDLEIYEREKRTDTATVLMIDISHSMILYGEDRITPAKKLAMALVHLIETRFPRDRLKVVLFGDDAVEVEIDELNEIQAGPFHTNTQMGLRQARKILAGLKQSNKQIMMITDGKPSMIKLTDGSYYKNSFGLDPEIVSRTLDEAILCRKKGITLSTFMVTEDPVLRNFVQTMTRVSRGRAFYSSLDQLGRFILKKFLTGNSSSF